MRITVSTVILTGIVTSLTAFAPGKLAGQSAQEKATTTDPDTLVYRVDPIVVTATRGPRVVSKIPRPVSVVSQVRIDRLAPNTVTDLFRTLPGLDVTGVGVNQGRPSIRGQRGQRILLLEDGLRLNNSRRQQDFGEIPALVDVTGVERVEVVRGPASVLYGSDAIGGVVNIITRVPAREGLHGEASYRHGSVEGQNRGSARIYGRFGPLSVRAGGTIRDAGSYEAPAGTYGAIKLSEDTPVLNTGVEDRSFDLRLGYEASPRHAFFGKVETYAADSAGFGSVDPAAYAPGQPEIDILYPRQRFTKLTAGYRAQELASPIADRIEILAYGQKNTRNLNLGFALSFGPGAGMTVDNRNYTNIRTYGLRAEARKLAMPGLLLTYGMDLWRDRTRGTDHNTTVITGFGPPMTDVKDTPQLPDASYLSGGVFLQSEIQATDRLSIVAGTRYQYVRARTYATPGLEDQEPLSINDGTFVASANTLFRLSDHVSLVGTVGRAFRSPNLIERFFNGATPEGSGFQIRNPDLKPETSLNFDLGLRVRSGRLALEGFAFHNKIHDGIRIRPLNRKVDGVNAYQNTNVDELIFRGVELGGDLGLTGGLSVSGNYTWMDAKDALNKENPVGESFSSKVTGTVRYDDPGDRFWVSWQIRHNGDRKDVDLGDGNPIGDILPAFTVQNLRAGVTVWRTDSGMTHRLDIALTNLTNALYAEFSNAGFFRPEPKRNLTLTWQLTF